DVVGRRAGEVVVLHEHPTEVAAGPGLALHPDHVGAVLVPDPRGGTLEVVGEALVEDVVGDRDVVVGREDLGSWRQSGETSLRRVSAAVLRCAETFWRIEGLSQGRHRWCSNRAVKGCSLFWGCYQVTGSS